MKSLFLTAAAFILLNFPGFAISEIDYLENYNLKIVPLINSMKQGTFTGVNKINIQYRTLIRDTAKNCLVILPGRTEPLEKYAEVIYDLLSRNSGENLNFYLMDHRGQGSSGRMKSPHDMGHVDRFDNYVRDLETFIANQKLDQVCDQKFLLAHSLGGGIAVAYILKNPKTFDRVALTSPMLKIMTKPYSYKVARAIVQASTGVGRGAKFAIGQKGFNPDLKFEENTFTTSPVRFKMAMDMYEIYPVTKLGGVSNRWILEVMKATDRMRSRYHEINVPMRIFEAGIEVYSEPSEMEKICNQSASCKRLFLKSAKHEVLMDKDINRNIVIEELSTFFN